jgi:flavin-dependent dehydrogenase
VTPPQGGAHVAVVGGGPAGAVAALVLSRRGLQVTVLEARQAPAARPGECLPPGVTPLLRHLQLEDCLAADGHLRSLGNRFLWGGAEPQERSFLAGTRGDGWHLDRQRFEARLAAHASAAGATWRWGCRVTRVTRLPRGAPGPPPAWHLEVAHDCGREDLAVQFVADATGRRARIARRAGTRRLRYDRLIGISALLTSATPAADSYTLVEATPDGWWYSAVLPDGRMAAALFGDGDLLPPALLHPASAGDLWHRRLAATAATRERIERHGYRALAASFQVAPAESSRLDVIAGPGWLALGDAAAAYDPLSSHGIGSAMGSGFYGGHAAADLLAGRDEARWAYLEVMQTTYGAYLDLQRRCYADERRWPDSPFWSRRHDPAYCLAPLAADPPD